jgi:hypothetical protein
MLHSLRLRIVLLVLVSSVAIGGYWWYAGATPQNKEYHDFGDQRTMINVPHALNVLSNLPFILFGVLGIWFLSSVRSRRPGVFLDNMERQPYWVFFIGLVLTGIGSSYYHANPNNETLVWDRAALALTFMALFTSILAERVHVEFAQWALWPLVLFGVGSVFYWDHTDDLRLYYIVQFFPLFILPALLFYYPPRYTHGGDLLASLLCYGLAKALEYFDKQVYSTGFVSGHTLKHLVASLSAGFILLMLWHRQPRTAPERSTVTHPEPAATTA